MPPSWLDTAIEAAEKGIALDGNCAETYKALGLAYYFKGFIDRSLTADEKAIEIDPNHVPAIINASGAYMLFGEFDKAILLLRRALALDPFDVFAHAHLGHMHRLMGDFSAAAQFFDRMSELHPDFDFGGCLKALFLAAQGAHSRANDLMSSLVDAHHGSRGMLNAAGTIAALTGDFATAKHYYEGAIAFGPVWFDDVFMCPGAGLGQILIREGRRGEAQGLLSQAKGALEEAVEGGNGYVSVRYYLAAICAIEGKKTEAYDWLEKAIEAGWRDYQVGLMDPWFENLRNDDRFQQMIASVKASLDDMRRRVEAL
jgi:tetratricopeptide (TPR) repeat protein